MKSYSVPKSTQAKLPYKIGDLIRVNKKPCVKGYRSKTNLTDWKDYVGVYTVSDIYRWHGSIHCKVYPAFRTPDKDDDFLINDFSFTDYVEVIS